LEIAFTPTLNDVIFTMAEKISQRSVHTNSLLSFLSVFLTHTESREFINPQIIWNFIEPIQNDETTQANVEKNYLCLFPDQQ
jgi:hypothetical protein